jgi:hypothetical protein
MFNSHAECGTAFALSDEKDAKLMGQHYLFHQLSLTICHPK